VEASPVLFVHGFASSAEHNWRQPGWLDLLAELGRETIAVDLLGHGRAPRPTDPAEYASVEDRVAAEISGYEQVDAVGFSAGAYVLLRLASASPGRFRRLALLGIGGSVLTGSGDGQPPSSPRWKASRTRRTSGAWCSAAWPTARETTAPRWSPSCAGRISR
jgi:pimeloyl-ACP methyl ester carboxylesterase